MRLAAAPADPGNAAAVIVIMFECAICACLRPVWDALRLVPVAVPRQM